jgi:hypothetical protein
MSRGTTVETVLRNERLIALMEAKFLAMKYGASDAYRKALEELISQTESAI